VIDVTDPLAINIAIMGRQREVEKERKMSYKMSIFIDNVISNRFVSLIIRKTYHQIVINLIFEQV